MVSAFSSGVAALDTDANMIARDALARAAKLVPEEPCPAWADLGLAQIRLGDLDIANAALSLAKARKLLANDVAIDRLLALLEERRGRFAEAREHLKHAIALDPKDLRSRYTLVRELEREGGAEAVAVRILGEILKIAPDNLAARIDLARLASKIGDSKALNEAVRGLSERSGSWPANAREQLRTLEQAAGGDNPRLVTTRVLVLRNVLVTVPEFRKGVNALMLPTGTVGEPLPTFLRLAVPSPTPAPPDESLVFSIISPGRGALRKVDAVFLLIDPKDGAVTPLEADGRELRKADGSGTIAPFPGGKDAKPPTPHGVAVADWNSDYRPDLVLAGAGGVRLPLKQEENGSFTDVTAATKLGPETLGVEARGVWAADIEMDGDLDFVLGVRDGPTLVLINRGDGTFGMSSPFKGSADLVNFAWADLDGDGDHEAAMVGEFGVMSSHAHPASLSMSAPGRFVERGRPTRHHPRPRSRRGRRGRRRHDRPAPSDLVLGPSTLRS